MKKILFLLVMLCVIQDSWAQNATVSVPVSLGRNNCNGSGGQDSVYFFNYVSPNLSNNNAFAGCKPVLKTNYAPLSGYSTANKPFTIFNASIAFNPADQMIYYVWTDYNIPSPYKSYIWRWNPTACPTSSTGGGLDTVRTFNTDIGGLTFDANGLAYQLEFQGPAPFKAFLRTVNFTTGVIGTRDTLDLTGGKFLWNVGSGDITLTPSGQMYFVFNNKLFTPDYTDYGNPTHHIKCTYIDTVRAPVAGASLPGLAFGNGDLIASYNNGCSYRRVDPVTGDTAATIYTYAASKGVYSTDMTQINSGIGAAKKLVSVTPTGTPNQYDVVYDVYVRNYGNVPITNVQVSDNLGSINGILNVSNVSAVLTSNPAGVTLNAGYNGTVFTNLLAASQTLPCYPVANNNFTIRISCRLSNIQQGIVYNNSAIATANGWRSAALRDSSMNGSVPDLNQNDKPDDVGEGQPTPFLITITPTTPPCSVLAQTLYTQNFGTGNGMAAALPAVPSATTTYTGTATAPMGINKFSVAINASLPDPTNWISLADHTGGGRMMVVNADLAARIVYRDTMPVSCGGQQYSISFWAVFIGNSTYQTVCDGLGGFKYPMLLVRIRDQASGLVITQYTTDTIKATSWQQHGMKWVMPTGYSNIILEIVNAGPGGCGNDFALDDIVFGLCDPQPTVSISSPSACIGSPITFTADVTDPAVVPGTKQYQWQVATALAGPYTNIVGATGATYTINPVAAADTGKYYRVVVAGTGNILVATCQYISAGVKLPGIKPSVAPTSITAPSTTICYPGSVILTANGGTLGTGANYQWGTGGVVGTNPVPGATNSTLTVSPTSTSTYWVRIENTTSPCSAATGGVTLLVTVNQPSVAPASITGPDICNPGSTTLTANGGVLGTGANYQWGTGAAVGTNPIGGATNPTLTVSPTTTTTYWVRIQNTTAPCAAITGGVTKVVTVTQPSVAPTSITAPSTTICSPGSVTLTANGGTLGTGANYQWGTGSVIGTGPIAGATNSTLTVSPTTTTTYWVRIENTTSPCTAITGGTTLVINVNQPSIAPTGITGADYCNPGTTTLTANGGTLGTGANYQWGTGSVIGTNPIAGATNPTLTISPATTTTYWVRIQNTTAPCTATTGGVTKVVTVYQPSVAPASISTPSTAFCNTGSVTLTAVGGTLGTGANYQWGTGAVIGTNPIAGATNATLVVTGITTTTTYWVRIENTTSPCASTTGGTTTVITINQPSVAPTGITGADYCNPGTTTLTANGGTLGTGANYQWGTGSVIGTNPIAGATNPTLTISPATTTTYWVRIQNTTAPCTATTGGVTKVVTVYQPSVAPASISAPSTAFCNTGSVTLTAVGGTLGTGANYQWGTGSVIGTNPIAGATNPTLAVSGLTSTTTYWVRIENTTSPCASTTGGTTTVITINQSSAAPTSVTGTGYCNPGTATLTAIGGTLGTNANYQWGTGAVVGTSPIAGATNATLTVSPTTTTTYWVRIENTTAPCAANTSGLTRVITVNQPSVAATSAARNKNNICPGISVALSVVGGSLGTGASWKWYTGSCGGTLVGTGASINVTPSITTTYYVLAEGTCNITACQSVTVNINCNIDKDRDGIPDFVESGMNAAFADANSNGIINAYDPSYAGFVDYNNDYINDNFQADGDSDNDGILNYLDPSFPGRIDSNGDNVDDRFDRDLDGIINMLDLDSDNDGIPDTVEAYGVDTNGDGKIDNFTDTDGDGLSQNVDINNTGAYNTGLGLGNIDLDGDGVPNFLDLDSDGDGIPDFVETGGVDSNNDGKPDGAFIDLNGDGMHDNYINAGAILLSGPDADNNGRADNWPNKNFDMDLRPNAYDLDADGDGIVDVVEAGLPDSDLDGRADGTIGTNGWSTTISVMNTLVLTNTDTDSNPDYLDIDSDGDGIPDNIEGQTTASYKLPTLADADGDGIATVYDNTPSAYGGMGIFPYDHDFDGTPDYRDLDTDGDGQPDIVEGNDFNLDGKANDNVTPTGIDTDGDGLDNRFDSLNSTTNRKGTSYMLGNSGGLTGDATPGARCPVQKKTPGQIDRDWRFVGSVLPVEILSFGGVLQSNVVNLKWTIVASKEVDRFEVERSMDNSHYQKVATVYGPVELNKQLSYTAPDNISNIPNEILYYRLKVIGKNGEIKYSNVLVIRRTQTKTLMALMPNPARDNVTVRFYSDKESEVIIRLIDNLGKTVLVQRSKAGRGNNSILVSGLTKYSSGVYSLQLMVNDEIVTEKLMLMR